MIKHLFGDLDALRIKKYLGHQIVFRSEKNGSWELGVVTENGVLIPHDTFDAFLVRSPIVEFVVLDKEH